MDKTFERFQKLAFGKVIVTENESITKSDLKARIKEIYLEEAKKKKEKDVAPQEDVEITADAEQAPTDTIEPEASTGGDIDPTVKAIQDSLQKAFANAKTLGDEKLINQIGNTITMLVRTQVLGAQGVNENIEENTEENVLFKYDSLEKFERDAIEWFDNVIDLNGPPSDDIIQTLQNIKTFVENKDKDY